MNAGRMPQQRVRRHFGFTVVELTAALTIMGLLVSIVVPAILQAREAARRVQCQNNLRQIGIALHNHHDTHRALPPGWTGPQTSDDGTILRPADFGCLWAWGAYLLPQLDQLPLHVQLGVDRLGDPPPPGDVMDLALGVYLCPSDSGGQESGWGLYYWDTSTSPSSSVLVKGYAKSNYVAVNGNGVAPFQARFQPYQSLPSEAGIFGNATHTRIQDILDGTSHTVAVGEREMTRTYDKQPPRGAIWIRNVGELVFDGSFKQQAPSGNRPSLVGTTGLGIWPLLAIYCDANSVVGVTNRYLPLNQASYAFSSLHPGGAHFLFADGAVRFISENIDPTTYEKLGSIADGQLIADF